MRHYTIVIVILLACGTGAFAASGAPPTSQSGGSERLVLEDVPSVVGASKYEQKPREAPASVTIITSEEIERFGYRNLGEILESVRGFFTSYDRNYTYVGGRGFGPTGDYNTRILLLVDGHRTNEGVYDSTYFGNEAIVDVAVIDRVEIIRGPSSSLYGTNAVLGVVNVITKSGRSVQGAELSVQGASYSSYQGTATYGDRLDNGADLLVSGTWFDSGGQDLYFPEFDAPPTTDGSVAGADSERSASLFGKLSRGNFMIEGAYRSRDKTIPTAPFGTTFDTDLTRTEDKRAYLALGYDRELGQDARVSGSVSYDYYRYDGRYWFDPVVNRDYGYSQWWTAEGRYIRTFAARHKVIAGAEYRYDAQQDQAVWDEDPYTSYFTSNRNATTWGLFVQDEFRINDALTVNAGLRRDDYETFGGTTNPRLALIFGPTSATTIKVLYGRAFRAPNAYELFYEDGGASQKANPNLDAETTDTYELALEHSWRSLRCVASLYRYSIEDLISLTLDPGDSMLVFQNIDEVRAQGIELEIEGRFHPRLEGRISYVYQDAENGITGQTLENSPRHVARMNLTTFLRDERFLASLEMQSLSSRRTLYGTEAGSSLVTNVVFLGRELAKGMTITVGVQNLFDKQYGDPGGSEHTQAVIPQDGRNYRVGVRYQF